MHPYRVAWECPDVRAGTSAALPRLTTAAGRRTFPLVHALPPSCPPIPDFPPRFWNRVNEQIAFWQELFSHPTQPGDASPDELRKPCIARIKTRLKRIEAGKNAGRALFELSDYLACLIVIESRN